MSLSLVQFVRALADDMVLAPIYRKGAVMRSGRSAVGKNPHEDAHERNLDKHDAALLIEKHPKTLTAVGLWTGVRGNGYVILDVDRNHSALKRKWGESLQGAPVVTSTKQNAAKYIFRVPEELWTEVEGFAHSDVHNQGYEVLWKAQGLIYGAYPGSKDGKAPEGKYEWEGDPGAVPMAPPWLLAEMKAEKKKEGKGFISNKKALDVSDRTEDELAQIVQECLSVIPHRGVGSNSEWVRIGMAIHSVLPGDLGLTLWSAWSAEDPDFADEWARGNPCEGRWSSFKPGAVGLGSLIWKADQFDQKRARFCESSQRIIAEAEDRRVQEYRTAVLTHEQVIQQAKEILELDNPSEINHRMNGLAIAAGYRDKDAIEQLILSQLEYERKEKMTSWRDLKAENFQKTFLIPDVLPHPSVVLLHGAGGDGKSMTAWTIAKHVAMGIPFVVRGKHMPVKQGPVLLLNGDQPKQQIQEQLDEIEMPEDAPLHIVSNWQLKRYNEFCRLMDQVKPALVVIDSLIGCSSSDAFEENKSSFASPLYWLTKNNGGLFPATTILIIHHSNRQGGFRGTSSIRDAVDEVWALKKPDGGINSLPANCRIINIEKSRSGRGGTSLMTRMEADLTYSVSDATPEVDEGDSTPQGIVGRVLMRIRSAYPRTVSKAELNADGLVGGRVTAIQKALQRLEKKGLIVSLQEPGRYGKKLYQAVLARGEADGGCPPNDFPSPGTGPRVDNDGGPDDLSTLKPEGGHNSENPPSCPPSEPSPGAGSDQGGQVDHYPRARTQEEIDSVIDPAQWDQEGSPEVVDVKPEEVKKQSRIVSKGLDDVIDV